MDCRTALLTVLDQVDYTKGACGVTEMVGAVLPKEIIALARKAIAEEAAEQPLALDFCPECLNTGYRCVSPTILAKCSCQYGQSQ